MVPTFLFMVANVPNVNDGIVGGFSNHLSEMVGYPDSMGTDVMNPVWGENSVNLYPNRVMAKCQLAAHILCMFPQPPIE